MPNPALQHALLPVVHRRERRTPHMCPGRPTNLLQFFVFTLSLGLRDPISSDPVPYPRYGFGIGRRTLLTPAPWAFAILFLVHILFAGTAAFVQWTERGKDIVIRGLK
ncbi:hypothetical protein FRC08_009063, partial [Ceratobasidium sp. 394]